MSSKNIAPVLASVVSKLASDIPDGTDAFVQIITGTFAPGTYRLSPKQRATIGFELPSADNFVFDRSCPSQRGWFETSSSNIDELRAKCQLLFADYGVTGGVRNFMRMHEAIALLLGCVHPSTIAIAVAHRVLCSSRSKSKGDVDWVTLYSPDGLAVYDFGPHRGYFRLAWLAAVGDKGTSTYRPPFASGDTSNGKCLTVPGLCLDALDMHKVDLAQKAGTVCVPYEAGASSGFSVIIGRPPSDPLVDMVWFRTSAALESYSASRPVKSVVVAGYGEFDAHLKNVASEVASATCLSRISSNPGTTFLMSSLASTAISASGFPLAPLPLPEQASPIPENGGAASSASSDDCILEIGSTDAAMTRRRTSTTTPKPASPAPDPDPDLAEIRDLVEESLRADGLADPDASDPEAAAALAELVASGFSFVDGAPIIPSTASMTQKFVYRTFATRIDDLLNKRRAVEIERERRTATIKEKRAAERVRGAMAGSNRYSHIEWTGRTVSARVSKFQQDGKRKIVRIDLPLIRETPHEMTVARLDEHFMLEAWVSQQSGDARTYMLGAGELASFLIGSPTIGTGGFPILLFGDKGVGKTSALRQLCALMNWPMISFDMNEHRTTDDFVGTMHVVSENGVPVTKWVDGPLAFAMRHGFVLGVEELFRAPASCSDILRGVLEVRATGALVIPQTGEVLRPHRNFRFVGTDNSAGFGDERGLHPSIRVQDTATLDRLPVKMRVIQPSASQMRDIICSKSNVTKERAALMADVGIATAKLYEAGKIDYPVSLRRLIDWAQLTDLTDMASAFAVAVLNQCPPTERGTVAEIAQRALADEVQGVVTANDNANDNANDGANDGANNGANNGAN